MTHFINRVRSIFTSHPGGIKNIHLLMKLLSLDLVMAPSNYMYVLHIRSAAAGNFVRETPVWLGPTYVSRRTVMREHSKVITDPPWGTPHGHNNLSRPFLNVKVLDRSAIHSPYSNFIGYSFPLTTSLAVGSGISSSSVSLLRKASLTSCFCNSFVMRTSSRASSMPVNFSLHDFQERKCLV